MKTVESMRGFAEDSVYKTRGSYRVGTASGGTGRELARSVDEEIAECVRRCFASFAVCNAACETSSARLACTEACNDQYNACIPPCLEYRPDPPEGDGCPVLPKIDVPAAAGARTVCDVQKNPFDWKYNWFFRTCGFGYPRIVLNRDLDPNKKPCAFKAIWAHEQVHVAALEGACRRFKQCVNAATNPDGRIPRTAFSWCQDGFNDFANRNCRNMERDAYQRSIDVLKELLNDPKCRPELPQLLLNFVDYHRRRDNPPECP